MNVLRVKAVQHLNPALLLNHNLEVLAHAAAAPLAVNNLVGSGLVALQPSGLGRVVEAVLLHRLHHVQINVVDGVVTDTRPEGCTASEVVQKAIAIPSIRRMWEKSG